MRSLGIHNTPAGWLRHIPTPARSASRLLWPSIVLLATSAVVLTLTVRSTNLLPGESEVARWMAERTGVPGETLGRVMDAISSETVAPFVFVATLIAVWRLWGKYPAAVLGFAGLLTAATKISDLADRPRPSDELRWTEAVIGEGGFPSQHVVYAVLVFGMLAYLSNRYIESTPIRRTATSLFAGLAILMGPARVIAGDHWPADVIGGYLIAIPLLLSLIWVCTRAWFVLRQIIPTRPG